MSDEAALLRAIGEEPDDDTVRLVYADWLDEHDQPARAEFIRVQIEIAAREKEFLVGPDPRRDRQDELLKAHAGPWTSALEPFDRGKVEFTFHRGFPERLRIRGGTPPDFEILRRVPGLRWLDIGGGELTPAVLRDIARLDQLDKLRFGHIRFRENWLDLLDPLPCWTVVEIPDSEYGHPANPDWVAFQERRISKVTRLSSEQQRRAAIRYLRAPDQHGVVRNATVRPGQPVKSVGLSEGDSELRFLAYLPELEEIVISRGRETSAGLRYLSGTPNLKSIRLDESNAESLVPLMNCTTLEKLTYSANDSVVFEDDGLIGLERLTNLRHLKLRLPAANGLGDATLHQIGALRELRLLDIVLGTLEHEDSLAALAGLTNLESLTLDGELSSRAVHHLTEMRNLTFLSLNGNGLTDADLGNLTALKRLRTLVTLGSAVTETGARVLADQLPAVTIINDEHVVKSPRRTITFRRYQFEDFASVLLPTHWQYGEGVSPIILLEDGWEEVWGVGGSGFIRMLSEDGDAETVLTKRLPNLWHVHMSVLERNVVNLTGPDTASAFMTDDFNDRYLVGTVATGGRCVKLHCRVSSSRFDEFLPMFLYVARSLRVGEAAREGIGDEIEVAVAEL